MRFFLSFIIVSTMRNDEDHGLRKGDQKQSAIRYISEKRVKNMLRKTAEYMEQQDMVRPDQKIVIGLSGGVDSVCLFHLLNTLGYSLEAVHVHHGIRGAEADRDEEFVRTLCQQFGVPFHGFHYDVPAISRKWHWSEEETGRILRRQAFAEVMKQTGAERIALAHHGNDRAETLLFHLCRGSGIRGLSSMKPTEGVYIRPLLWAERAEIERYAEKMGYDYVKDGTNDSDDYTRNKIRHQVIPLLEQINPRSTAHIFGTAEKLSAVSAYLDREADKLFERSVVIRGQELLVYQEPFLQGDPVLQIPVLQKCVEYFKGSLVNITEEHLFRLQRLMKMQTGKEIHLPDQLTAVRTYDGIKLFYQQKLQIPEPVEIRGEGCYHAGAFTITVRIEEWEAGKNIPIKNYTKCFDYDKITENVFFRTRKTGDYLEINKNHGRKSIQDYLVNEKVPKEQRDQILLLADGNHVLWVVGKRISEYYKVTEKTKRVLKVQVNGGNVHEEF